MPVLGAIMASKMFASSSRRGRILDELRNPNNTELLKQLSISLEDPSLAGPPKIFRPKEDEDRDKPIKDVSDPEMIPTGDRQDTTQIEDDVIEEVEDSSTEDGTEPVEDENTEPVASTSTPGTKVMACYDGDTQRIKDSLNTVEETAGVTRIAIKDCELWIFYKDDIDLNDVMVPVIEYLNYTGYTQYEFSRLARTNNAIVFKISFIDTTMKTIEEVTNV